MDSALRFVNDFVSFKSEAVNTDTALTVLSDPLLEEVRQLQAEIRIWREQLAQAEFNLAQRTASLCDALCRDMELRKLANARESATLMQRSTENAPFWQS